MACAMCLLTSLLCFSQLGAWWVAAEASRFLVNSRLRSPYGGPAQVRARCPTSRGLGPTSHHSLRITTFVTVQSPPLPARTPPYAHAILSTPLFTLAFPPPLMQTFEGFEKMLASALPSAAPAAGAAPGGSAGSGSGAGEGGAGLERLRLLLHSFEQVPSPPPSCHDALRTPMRICICMHPSCARTCTR